MENLLSYVAESAVILVPVLYVVGAIIKGTEFISDKFIPLILLPFGIIGSVALAGFTADAIMQGILVTGVTVYGNQIIKQLTKAE